MGNNLFSYCENNPVNLFDSFGRNPLAIIAGIGATIASAIKIAVQTMIAVTAAVGVAHGVGQVADRVKTIAESKTDNSPRDQSVYLLKDKNDEVRYVGRTNDPARRMKEHIRDTKHPERKDYTMTVVFSGLTDAQSRVTEQVLISAYSLKHLDNARREIAAGRVHEFRVEISFVAEMLGGFAEDEILNLGRS